MGGGDDPGAEQEDHHAGWLTIWVPGKPISYGAKGQQRRYAEARLKRWEETIGWEWRKAHGRLSLPGPVRVVVQVYLANSTQDIDNLLKAVLDGLKNVAFGDDKLVYSIQMRKEPSDKDGSGVMVSVAQYAGPVFETHG